MKTICEVVITNFMPAVRAMVTKELTGTYGLSQSEVAKKLQITQPAVSYYQRELRGAKVRQLQSNEKVVQFVKNLSAEIANGTLKVIDLHGLYKTLKEEKILNGEFLECSCSTS